MVATVAQNPQGPRASIRDDLGLDRAGDRCCDTRFGK